MTMRCVQSSTVLSPPILDTSSDGFTLCYGTTTVTYDDPDEAQRVIDQMNAGVAHLRRRQRLAAGEPTFTQVLAGLVPAAPAGDL